VIKAIKSLYNSGCRRSSLGILRQGLLADGQLTITDIDHRLTVATPSGPAPCLVDLALYIATGDLDAAIRAANDTATDDFPAAPKLVDAVELPADICAGLLPVAGACALDETRDVLRHVHINHTAQRAEATDGHRCFMRDIPTAPPESFLVDPVTLRLLDQLPAASVGLLTAERLYFAGDGWSLTAKRPEGPYPVVQRAIPTADRTPPVEWTAPVYKSLKAWLAAAKPFLNPKTYLVYFSSTEGITRNPELNHPATARTLGAMFDLPDDMLLGMNAKYLSDTLAYIANRPAQVTAGTSGIAGVIWSGDGWLALQMPLRTHKSGVMTRSDLFAGVAYDAE
jgi:hypothetical protein